jgi:hypothetical protein
MQCRNRIITTIIALLICALPALSEAETPLRTYVAHYQVKFRGMNGGVLQFTLRKGDKPDQYIYETSAKPSFLGGFFVSDKAHESSVMEIAGDEIRPLSFNSDDGKKSDAKDVQVRFSWSKHHITGRSEAKPVDLEVPARAQDHLSIQVAVVWDLSNGRELGTYPMFDGGEMKSYDYRKDGEEQISYEGRDLDTVIVRSEHTGGGSRVSRYWHAPELGYLPIRAERTRKGELELVLQLIDVKFTE